MATWSQPLTAKIPTNTGSKKITLAMISSCPPILKPPLIKPPLVKNLYANQPECRTRNLISLRALMAAPPSPLFSLQITAVMYMAENNFRNNHFPGGVNSWRTASKTHYIPYLMKGMAENFSIFCFKLTINGKLAGVSMNQTSNKKAMTYSFCRCHMKIDSMTEETIMKK